MSVCTFIAADCPLKEVEPEKDGFLNMLSKIDNMLLAIQGQTLHMDVYNPTLAAIANLSMLERLVYEKS